LVCHLGLTHTKYDTAWRTRAIGSLIRCRLSHCGIVLRRSFLVVDSTQQVLTCGRLVPFSPRCVPASHCSLAIQKLTKSSRSSSMFDHLPDTTTPTKTYRLLGTPDETTWPGVTSFPDFKSSFPKWRREHTAKLVPTLEPAGQELLDALLEYDPSQRMSAKQACNHPYFAAGSAAYSQRGPPRTNGYH
jgi:serine/threonine protein kinase